MYRTLRTWQPHEKPATCGIFMSGIAIPLCVIPVSLRHIVSDPRPQVV